MKINLGYVAISKTINLTSSKTMTYTNYLKLDKDISNQKLDKIIKENFYNLKQILYYNIKNDIKFYRMTSNLIPLATHPSVNFEIFKRYKKEFKEIGYIIKKYHLRVDMHPSEYVVLNSVNENVVANSINILKFHEFMFKAMGLDGILILHIGSGILSKEEGIKRFKRNFKKLDNSLKKMIVLENDDKVFNIKDTLKLCQDLNIRMCLDYHHYKCNNEGELIEDYIRPIFDTWKSTPKIHFSSPKSKSEFRSHSDYIDVDDFIDFLEKIKFVNRDFDIMLECKEKDQALFTLIRQIKYKTEYKFKKNAFFLN